jgi:predicted nucleic acid-binding protein
MKLKTILLFFIILSQSFALGRNPLINRGFYDRYFGRPDTNYSLFISNKEHLTERLLSSASDLEELQSLCSRKKFPVSNVYVELDNYQLFRNELNSFLHIMAKHNIKTYYVIQTDNSTANTKAAEQTVADFVSFNNTLQFSFTGLHISYNPSANYTTLDNALLNSELSFLEKVNSLRRKTKLQLSAILPNHFALQEYTEKYLPKFFNYLNTVIAYQPSINSDTDNSLLDYAEEVKTEFLITPEYNSSFPQAERKVMLQTYLEWVSSIQKKYKMFNSVVLSYEDFKELSTVQL